MATNQIKETEGTPDIVEILIYAQGWRRPGGKRVVWNWVDREHNPPSDALVQGLFNETLDAAAAVA